MEDELQRWISWGLDGLETRYGRYIPEETAWANGMVEKYGLIEGGGSDFHGVSKPDISLGNTTSGSVPDEVLEKLKAKRRGA